MNGKRSTHSDALVLRTRDLGDSDRIVVLLSEQHGRIDAVAAGARRLKSRFGASLEPLSKLRVAWRQTPGRELARLVAAELVSSPYAWLSRPATLECFAAIIRIAETVSLPGQAHPHLYRLMSALVEAGEQAGESTEGRAMLRLYAEVWVARLEGFWPSLEACAGCGAELGGWLALGRGADGALCRSCSRGLGSVSVLRGSAIELARRVLSEPPSALTAAPGGRQATSELTRAARMLLTDHLERDFRLARVAR